MSGQQYSNGNNVVSITPTQAPSGPLANYTLPGVISYLTSEFTNLERFKIMTNLEKSEMKYRIQQLTSELNSTRYVNEKQALRIKHLESVVAEQNKMLDKSASTEKEAKSEAALSEPEPKSAGVAKETANSSGRSSTREAGQVSGASKDIPHVDLEILRSSRQNLNKSIQEIILLLKQPLGLDVLRDHLGSEGRLGFDELMDDSEHFTFGAPVEEKRRLKEDLFSRFTIGTDDILKQPDLKTDEAPLALPMENLPPLGSVSGEAEEGAGVDESDTETVIVDEPEIVNIITQGAVPRSPKA